MEFKEANYSYLKPSGEDLGFDLSRNLFFKIANYINSTNPRIRRIFFNQEFEKFEKESIEKFKAMVQDIEPEYQNLFLVCKIV